jgi:cyclic pyranopterin phosphate synthase
MEAGAEAEMEMRDTYGRRITDLRVSVTDRCDFRCIYCRSADPENHMPLERLLTWDELERVVSILLPFGIRKVRVTGGEPLVRAGLAEFIGKLSALGVEDLSMTTNARMLAPRVNVLVAAGLRRINISLDSLDRERFERITRIDAFDDVIKGIDAAQASALAPVKVNAVLVRGVNDGEVEAFAEFARDRQLIMRFIEVMPLDGDRHWSRSMVVTGAEVLKRIRARWELIPVAHERSETARRYRFADGRGEIGLVSPVSEPFCGFCSRVRLTADGKLRTCLFSREDHDLRPLLRGSASDAEIAAKIEAIVAEKEAGHRINEPDFVQPARTMVFIGG